MFLFFMVAGQDEPYLMEQISRFGSPKGQDESKVKDIVVLWDSGVFHEIECVR